MEATHSRARSTGGGSLPLVNLNCLNCIPGKPVPRRIRRRPEDNINRCAHPARRRQQSGASSVLRMSPSIAVSAGSLSAPCSLPHRLSGRCSPPSAFSASHRPTRAPAKRSLPEYLHVDSASDWLMPNASLYRGPNERLPGIDQISFTMRANAAMLLSIDADLSLERLQRPFQNCGPHYFILFRADAGSVTF